MSIRRILGTEEARKQFASLVERPSQGKTTFITRHGKPCAALVPLSQAQGRRGESFLSLRGSGKGLYGSGHMEFRRAIDKGARNGHSRHLR